MTNRPGENTKEFFETGINKDQIVDEWLAKQKLTRDDVDSFRTAKEAGVTPAEITALETAMVEPLPDPDQLFLMPEGIGEDKNHLCDGKKCSDCGDNDNISAD